MEHLDLAGAGREIRQPFRIDPHFDGMAADLQLTLRERREAEGLVEMAEWISLLKLRARRLSRSAA
jgi:hypothetical protein